MLPSSYLRNVFLSVIGSLLESLPHFAGVFGPLPISSNFLLLQLLDLAIEPLLGNEQLLIPGPDLNIDSIFTLLAARPLMRSNQCTSCIAPLELIYFSSYTLYSLLFVSGLRLRPSRPPSNLLVDLIPHESSVQMICHQEDRLGLLPCLLPCFLDQETSLLVH